MMTKFQTILTKLKIHRLIFGIGIFYLFTQYFWKTKYIGGDILGFYWMFVFLDNWYIEFVLYTFSLTIIVFIFWLIKKGESAQLSKLFGALGFTGLAISATFPVVLALHTVFVDRLQIDDTVYYLSAYPMFAEVNYTVAECEATGHICKTIFRSEDITGTYWLDSYLVFDEISNQLLLMEEEMGVIFSTSSR